MPEIVVKNSYASSWGKLTVETRQDVELPLGKLRRAIASDLRFAVDEYLRNGPTEKDAYGFISLNIAPDRVVAQVARALKKTHGADYRPSKAELFAASMQAMDKLLKQVNRSKPATISQDEVDRANKQGGRLGDAVVWTYGNETYDKGWQRKTVVDTRVKKLRTDREYLKYNVDFLDEVGSKVTIDQVPAELRSTVRQVRRDALKMLSWDGPEAEIYAVRRSPSDRTVIGYAVRGTASTDDGDIQTSLIAIDFGGKRVVVSDAP